MTDPLPKISPFLDDASQRKAVLEELEHTPPNQRVEAWISSGAPLIRGNAPDNPPIHLVCYAVLVDRGAILLGHHLKAERWLPTGGHVNRGEHPRDTACRELQEELDLRQRIDTGPPLLATWAETVGNSPMHVDVSLWYAFLGNRNENYRADPVEFSEIRWFDRDNLPTNRDPNLSAFLDQLT